MFLTVWGESQEREDKLSPHQYRSLPPADTMWNSAAVPLVLGEALPGAMSLSLLCASWGLSWLELALPNAKHLQIGFANNWLKVLSFCGLIQVPGCRGRLVFFGYQLRGGGKYTRLGLRDLGLGPSPVTLWLSDRGPRFPSL